MSPSACQLTHTHAKHRKKKRRKGYTHEQQRFSSRGSNPYLSSLPGRSNITGSLHSGRKRNGTGERAMTHVHLTEKHSAEQEKKVPQKKNGTEGEGEQERSEQERNPRGLIIRGSLSSVQMLSQPPNLTFFFLAVSYCCGHADGRSIEALQAHFRWASHSCLSQLEAAFCPRTITTFRQTAQSHVGVEEHDWFEADLVSHLSEWRPKSRCTLLPGELLPWFVKS